MARRTTLGDALDPVEDQEPQDHQEPVEDESAAATGDDDHAGTAEPATQTTEPDANPRKGSQRKSRAGGQAKAATKTKTPAAGKKTASRSAAKKTTPAPEPEPEVLAVDTQTAKRVGLYLHPDDYRALAMAKVEDGADLNSRIRAMIALWRHDQQRGGRTSRKIDQLARTSPRGGMH